MEYVFFLLYFFSIVALILGLIKPGIVVRWGNKQSRGRVLLIYGLSAFVFLVMFGITAPPIEELKDSSAEIKKVEAPELSGATVSQAVPDVEKKADIIVQPKPKIPTPEPGNEYTSDELLTASIVMSFIETEYLYSQFKDKHKWAINRGLSPAIEGQKFLRKLERGEYLPLMEWSIYWMNELSKLSTTIDSIYSKDPNKYMLVVWGSAIHYMRMMRQAWWASPDGTGNYGPDGSIAEWEELYIQDMQEIENYIMGRPDTRAYLMRLRK